jgi:XTP/dITP diphosphohydrolase
MMKIFFITGNHGKFSEIKQKLGHLNIEIVKENIGYPEIQADTLEDVAKYGVDDIRKRFNDIFIIEDAGIFIKALDGFPGVYSKFVHSTIGCNGIIKLMSKIKDRSAIFRSIYGYSEPDFDPIFFVGECCGKISESEKGKGGFGYDPIFIPDGESVTFAEMNTNKKNEISHRGIALDNLMKFLIEVKGVK